MVGKTKSKKHTSHKAKPWSKALKAAAGALRYVRSKKWWIRWPVYLVSLIVFFFCASWVIDKSLPPVKNPEYGVSFSTKYAQELGNDWQANFLGLLDDLHIKNFRLMSYWDTIEPQQGKYDFTNLDWQINQAGARGAKVSLAIGLRQPRWPECHEPEWAKSMPVESDQWKSALYGYITTVVNRYKNNPAIESYQLENESANNWFGTCRQGPAPKGRLIEELKMVKQLDPNHPTWMSLSDEHGFPLGNPVPDAYGFSIYRIVYSTQLPIHFYLTYPITDLYHRGRAFLIEHIKHRPVFIHELQLEPWGPKATVDLDITEQNKSMNVDQIHESIMYARKTGIKREYMWGAEWWYWRKTHFNDAGPWNAVKQEITSVKSSSN
jgi:hypothetical protein